MGEEIRNEGEEVVPDLYRMLEEQEMQRTFVNSYRDGGWIIGSYGDYYIIWLDHFAERPVFVMGSDLAW